MYSWELRPLTLVLVLAASDHLIVLHGQEVPRYQTEPPPTPSSSSKYGIIGGSVFLSVIVVGLCAIYFKCRKRRSRSLRDSRQIANGGNLLPVNKPPSRSQAKQLASTVPSHAQVQLGKNEDLRGRDKRSANTEPTQTPPGKNEDLRGREKRSANTEPTLTPPGKNEELRGREKRSASTEPTPTPPGKNEDLRGREKRSANTEPTPTPPGKHEDLRGREKRSANTEPTPTPPGKNEELRGQDKRSANTEPTLTPPGKNEDLRGREKRSANTEPTPTPPGKNEDSRGRDKRSADTECTPTPPEPSQILNEENPLLVNEPCARREVQPLAQPEPSRAQGSNQTANAGNPESQSRGAQLGRSRSTPRALDSTGAPRLFTYEELELATDGFSKSKKLGKEGTVYKGVLPDNKIVAVKTANSNVRAREQLENEIMVISQVRHRHIISLVGYYIDEDEARGMDMLLVYEFIPNGSLQSHLHERGPETMDWETRMKIAIGSAKGLAYLHEGCQLTIIHRDIKPHNILLLDDFEPKIAGFGLARLLPETDSHVLLSELTGSIGYLAPECASSGRSSEKSDVYAFGVVLLELITGRKAHDKLTGSLVEWARPRLPEALNSRGRKLKALADPRLQNNYDREQMFRMVSCADSCIRESDKCRPQMSQVVQTLSDETTGLDNDFAKEAIARRQREEDAGTMRRIALGT
ncbi:proline-rich receptor-like protein kinase PERK3 [Neltuma alba]|uniref:proline-rich receptor-like protein kinase PERK3 n=1 Tax=Neltuma alba TaxID=207710 RepID=UPI0010A3E4DF|nr:proline-rich receptor-like protein kinase PERK3 [Prosopis alba]